MAITVHLQRALRVTVLSAFILAVFPSLVAATSAKQGSLAKPSASKIKQMRREAANRRRRVIFNNDGCDALCFPDDQKPTPENLLAIRTSPLLGSHVDTISYCTVCSGFSNFTHNTKIGSVLTVPHPDPDTKNITQDLIDQGTDTLKVMVDFCHKNNLEIFWSMRMNDTHDQEHRADKPYFLFPPLKTEHPEYLIGAYDNRPPYGSWTSVDYTVPEVRDLAFKFIEEVCRNYDIDGLDLDFCRHLCYFKSVAFGGRASQAELDMMTDLMRRVRVMADEVGLQRGRPILIAMRVPDSVEYCQGVGLDVERWMAEDLVDLIFTSAYFRANRWEYSVDLAHQYGVKAYPCLTDSRVGGEDSKFSRQSQLTYRARAMEAWAAEPEGIYVYNDYNPRSKYLWEIGVPGELQKLNKTYFVTVMNGNSNTYLANGSDFLNLPLLTPSNGWPILTQPQAVEIAIGDDLGGPVEASVTPQVKCFLRCAGLKDAADISVSLNGKSLSNGKLAGQWAEYPVDPTIVKKGLNTVEVSAKPRASRKDNGATPEVWNMNYKCDKVLTYATQLPWRRLHRFNSDWKEEIRDGALYFADFGAGEPEWAGLVYPWWGVSPDGLVVIEARLKVESSTDPLGVCIRVSNGQAVEYVTFQEDRVSLHFAKLSYLLDTTADFHDYRIVMDGADIEVYADGQRILDGAGTFTTSALDETHWVDFMEGLRPWNKNCLLFGSASGLGTGAAYWQYIRFRTESISLLDLVMTVSYE